MYLLNKYKLESQDSNKTCIKFVISPDSSNVFKTFFLGNRFNTIIHFKSVIIERKLNKNFCFSGIRLALSLLKDKLNS